jgi:DNA polymerase III sliding clamp (beta) subunit (PCNA family)
MSKITLPTTKLKQALSGLAKVASRKNDGSPNSLIKVEQTNEGQLTLSACDKLGFVSVKLEQTSCGASASAIVPFEELQRSLRVCDKNEYLELESQPDKSTLLRYQIAGQWVQQTLPVHGTEDFPTSPTLDGLQIPIPESLQVAIGEGLSCTSSDPNREVLNGLLVDVSTPFCHAVVGTDGRHLYASNSFSLPLKDSFILPKSNFLGWREFNKDGGWKLRVSSAPGSDRWCELSCRRWTVTTKAVEGVYPNWRQVMPKASDVNSSVEMDPAQVDLFLSTIEKMPCNDMLNQRIGLQLENGKLFLFVKTREGQPQLKIEVQGATVSGNNLAVELNRRILSKALTFGLTRMEFVNDVSPVRFVNGGKQMLLMPIRGDAAQASQERVQVAEDEEDEQIEEDTFTDEPCQTSSTSVEPSVPEQNRAGEEAEETENPVRDYEDETEGSALQEAIAKVESLRVVLNRTSTELDTVLKSLHLAEREQEAKEREIEHVRVTLQALKNMRI